MQSIRFVHNEQNRNQIKQIQPHLHKVLKKSLKITLKSVTKQKNQTSSLDKYIPLPTNRLSKSIVQSKQIRNNSKLKNQIDGRLNRVYSIMTKHAEIKLGDDVRKYNHNKNKSNSIFDNKIKCDPFSIINEKNPQIYKQLPYELIQKYIFHIYQEYQLNDPLSTNRPNQNKSSQQTMQIKNNQTPIKSTRLESYRTSTKKKILLLKNNFVNQLNENTKRKQKLNLSTPRKLITQLNGNQTLNQLSKNSSKGIGLSTKKKLNLNLKLQTPNQNQQSMSFQNQTSYFQNFNNNDESIQQKLFNQTLGQTKLTSSLIHFGTSTIFHSINSNNGLNDSIQFNKNFNPMQKNKKIKQLFRYCFVCQQPILQVNMIYHEKQCVGLTKILNDENLTYQSFALLINQKIKKLQKQLQQVFINIQQKQTTSKLTKIKQNVIEWIKMINSTQQQKQQIKNKKRQQQYQKINQAIKQTKILKSFQLINKLNWFLHLKINFIKNYKKNV